ncbi:LacI family DNA-binding transcriptional regulator, partial [Nocardiopsis flavescens]|uniref:LacI family DNA-binding transcriptional regulator n=1 Tax=Nocardiopsis flavescens TaxID=758803 RepID=UPI003650F70A
MTSSRPRPATIGDIARRAGVSTAAVSYVLNDAPGGARIPEETRERVRAAADEMGYVPGGGARGRRPRPPPRGRVVGAAPARGPRGGGVRRGGS